MSETENKAFSCGSAAISLAVELQMRIAGPFTLVYEAGCRKDSVRLMIKAEGRTPETKGAA